MSFAEWSMVIGMLLVTMVLAGTLLGRLPLSSAMVYLALGWMLGPDGANVLRPDPVAHAALLERLAEVALLISLFAVGLRLGVPLRDGTLAAAAAPGLPVDGDDGGDDQRHRRVVAAAAAGHGRAAGGDPGADRPGTGLGREVRSRHRSRPAGLQPRGRRWAERRRRVPLCHARSGSARAARPGPRAGRLVEHRPAVGHAGRHRHRRCAGRGMPAAWSCTCASGTARPWAWTSSWAWAWWPWPTGSRSSAWPRASWRCLPPAWHCSACASIRGRTRGRWPPRRIRRATPMTSWPRIRTMPA